MPEDVWARIEA